MIVFINEIFVILTLSEFSLIYFFVMGSCLRKHGQRNKPNESIKPEATYESFLNFVQKQTREGTIDTRYKWAENEEVLIS